MHVLSPRFLFVTSLTVLLASCAVTTEDCDPRNANAGFGTKLGCSSRGVYAQRVEQKQKILLDEQKANQLFRQTYAALDAERRNVGKKRSQQQAQAAALNRAMSALLDELKDKAAGNQEVEGKIAALERDMAQRQKRKDAPSVLQAQHEIQQLQDQLQSLESDLGLR